MAVRDISMTTEQTPSMVEDFALSSLSVFEDLVKIHSQSKWGLGFSQMWCKTHHSVSLIKVMVVWGVWTEHYVF